MRRFLLAWFVPVVLLLFGALPRSAADDLHPGLGKDASSQTAPPSPQAAPADAGDKVEKPPPTFAYFVAVAATLIVLCILCVPSRKAESSTARR